MGLAIVYGIVKQSGGHIYVQSEEGKGTAFHIYLPCVEEEPISSETEESPIIPEGKEIILFVEDEALVRDIAIEVLRRHGYTILEASNGIEALQVANNYSGAIHLLITDMVMPQMGGRELADKLLDMRPDLSVLYISGYTDDTIIRHTTRKSNQAFMQKPFNPVALAQKVRELLDRNG